MYEGAANGVARDGRLGREDINRKRQTGLSHETGGSYDEQRSVAGGNGAVGIGHKL